MLRRPKPNKRVCEPLNQGLLIVLAVMLMHHIPGQLDNFLFSLAASGFFFKVIWHLRQTSSWDIRIFINGSGQRILRPCFPAP